MVKLSLAEKALLEQIAKVSTLPIEDEELIVVAENLVKKGLVAHVVHSMYTKLGWKTYTITDSGERKADKERWKRSK